MAYGTEQTQRAYGATGNGHYWVGAGHEDAKLKYHDREWPKVLRKSHVGSGWFEVAGRGRSVGRVLRHHEEGCYCGCRGQVIRAQLFDVHGVECMEKDEKSTIVCVSTCCETL